MFKFIPFKEFLSMYSTWVLGLVAISPTYFDIIPEQYRIYAMAGIGTLGLFVRAIKQNKIK